MELAASAPEAEAMLRRGGGGAAARPDYLTFVSAISNTTEQSVRVSALPVALAESGPNTTVEVSDAVPGQFLVIQVAVLALQPVTNASVRFSKIGKIGTDAMTCFQTDGVDVSGHIMPHRPWSLAAGDFGALLIGIAVPEATADGSLCGGAGSAQHTGSFEIAPLGGRATRIAVAINVSCARGARQLDHAGPGRGSSAPAIDASDVWRLERMAWLNSRVGIEETVTRPFSPLSLSAAGVLHCLGRSVKLSALGLPGSVESNGVQLLGGDGIEFEVLGSDGNALGWQQVASSPEVIMHPNATSAGWTVVTAASSVPGLTMTVEARIDYTCHLDYGVTLTVPHQLAVADTRLVVPVLKSVAKYAIGAGMESDGGAFPYANISKMEWRWTNAAGPGQQPVAGGPVTGKDGFQVWAGDADAGLFVKLKGAGSKWNCPTGEMERGSGVESWANGNRGGWSASVNSDGSIVQLIAAAGNRTLSAGSLLFNFSMVPTPTKGAYTTTTKAKHEHYTLWRHFHIPYGQWEPETPAALAKSPGATTIILHQSNRLNPYIGA
jgi:hypothetical protein